MSDLTAQSQQVFSPEKPFTSPTIKKIQEYIDENNHNKLRVYALYILQNAPEMHYLDFMALGRACHLMPNLNVWGFIFDAPLSLPKQNLVNTKEKLASCMIGYIAAQVEARNTKRLSELGEGNYQESLYYYHSLSATCSNDHVDPTVRRMAAWCAAHLNNDVMKRCFLNPTPEPFPTQTPPPCQPG